MRGAGQRETPYGAQLPARGEYIDRGLGGAGRMADSLLTSVGHAELELDVIWVSEKQYIEIEPELRAEILDLSMWHSALVKQAKRPFELIAAVDREREVIEAHAVLVKTIATDGARWIRSRVNAHDRAAVTQEHGSRKLGGYLKSEDLCVESARSSDVANREADVVDGASVQLDRHESLLRHRSLEVTELFCGFHGTLQMNFRIFSPSTLLCQNRFT